MADSNQHSEQLIAVVRDYLKDTEAHGRHERRCYEALNALKGIEEQLDAEQRAREAADLAVTKLVEQLDAEQRAREAADLAVTKLVEQLEAVRKNAQWVVDSGVEVDGGSVNVDIRAILALRNALASNPASEPLGVEGARELLASGDVQTLRERLAESGPESNQETRPSTVTLEAPGDSS